MMNARGKFRRDIEGLRALAVTLVLLHHADLQPTGGFIGVDIFFVISGYLITRILMTELEANGTIQLASFFAKRAKRLLPASLTVLIFCGALTLWLAPLTQKAAFMGDIAGASAYFSNWRFALRSVDYLSEDLGRSPVLHFWSLSVEEQYYFLWPFLLLFIARCTKFFRVTNQTITTFTLASVCLTSLIFSIWYTQENAQKAFFVSPTRFWEMALGGLLSISQIDNFKDRNFLQGKLSIGSALSLMGLLGIVGATYWVDRETRWPSANALIPALATIALIAGGTLNSNSFLTRLLSTRAFVFIGAMSYSLYLWHWPFLVIGQDWLRLEGPIWACTLIILSAFFAWLSHRWIEAPFRRIKPNGREIKILILGSISSLSLALVAGISYSDTSKEFRNSDFEFLIQNQKVEIIGPMPGAQNRGEDPIESSLIFPTPLAAPKDVPIAYAKKCQASFSRTKPTYCKFGDPNGRKEVWLIGDSKILQYQTAFDAIGKALGWKVTTATKSSCQFTASTPLRSRRPYDECVEFNKIVLSDLLRLAPDIVFTSQDNHLALPPGVRSGPGTRQAMSDGVLSYWSKITAARINLIVIIDNPRPPKRLLPVYECVLNSTAPRQNCSFLQSEGLQRGGANLQLETIKRLPTVQAINLNDHICAQEQCFPIVGGVLVYRQGAHLTDTFVRTLTPTLMKRIQALELKFP